MPTDTITLGKLAKRKNLTIDELTKLFASMGVNISNIPDLEVDIDEVALIDTSLAIELKAALAKSNKKTLRKNKGSSANAANTQNNSEAPSHEVHRCIGIIKFFDASKGFGFAVSNAWGTNSSKQLVDFYLQSSEFQESLRFYDGKWISFIPKLDTKGYTATDIKALAYDASSFRLALQYIGEFAKIEGIDTKQDKTYDSHIIDHIAGNIIKKDGGKRIIWDELVQYIDNIPTEQQQSAIQQFLTDAKIKDIIQNIAWDGIEFPESLSGSIIKEEVIKDKLTQKPIDLNFVLKLWNSGYDLQPYKVPIRENIENGLNG